MSWLNNKAFESEEYDEMLGLAHNLKLKWVKIVATVVFVIGLVVLAIFLSYGGCG